MEVPVSQRAIYLHVGPPKTGTTYLQDVLWGNRPRLAELGFAFPGHRLADHFHAALDLRGMQFGGYDHPDVPGAWTRLAKAATASGQPRVIVSHEIFGGADEQQIARLAADLAPHELHLVFGARDVARQLPAVWQESLKNRKSRTFDAFLATALAQAGATPARGFWRAQDIVRTLARWSDVIAAERIHVVTLPATGAATDTLWRRFATALSVPATGFDLEVARPNASLSAEHAELLRRLNKALPADLMWPEYERLVKHTFNRLPRGGTADEPPATRVRVPQQYRQQLDDWSGRTCAALARSGYDIVGDLDDLIPGSEAFGAGADVLPDRVADAAVAVLVTALTDRPRRRTGETKDRARTLMGQLRRGRGQ